MARLSVFLNQSPFLFDSHLQAMEAIRAASQQHHIDRVFFYQDATLAGLNHQQPPQGQPSITHLWQVLAQELGVPLQSCIANSLRRGIFNQQEANRYNAPANLADGFELTGLGEMAEAVATSDHILQFPTQRPHKEKILNAHSTVADLLIHINTPPTLDLEALELGMACAAFDQEVAFVFQGAGCHWLHPNQEELRPGGKSPAKLIRALAMYDCEQIYAVQSDNTDNTPLHSAAKLISTEQLASLQINSKHYLSV